MYFTSLPDNTKPEYDEQSHFEKFKKHNIIFNAMSSYSHCDNHVGCLSFKTVLSGEEWYCIGNQKLAVRPGQFLILNDDQNYSCYIDNDEKVQVLSIFFKKEFASSVFAEALYSEATILENPFHFSSNTLEFFQTLYNVDTELNKQLFSLITALNYYGYNSSMVDEYLVFLLRHLIRANKSESIRAKNVNAIKPNTKTEVYKRLCIAKDVLHSFYMDKLDLAMVSNQSCLSVPQLIRQFKSVFHATPHQYLTNVRLRHAAEFLKLTDKPVHEIAWRCGFENTSAFCRAFKSEFSIQPIGFRAEQASKIFN
jgi:AraC family transcriptional regulator